jgi:hypothetical protein
MSDKTITDAEVEAVARAIAAEDGEPHRDDRYDEGHDPEYWRMYERHARAAIIALDEVRGR